MLSRLHVRPVVKTSGNVKVDRDEEERSSIGMSIPKKPPMVDIPHDVLNAGKGQVHMRSVVHGQKDPGQDLNHQKEKSQSPENIHVGLVTGHRIVHSMVVKNGQVLVFLPTLAHREGKGEGR